MYCYHCGAKLVSEARFCHQCGKSLDIPEEKLDDKTIQAIKECILSGEEEIAPEVIEEMMKPVQRVEGPEIVLNILGHKLVLSDDIAGLKVVRDYFTDYAEKNVAKYKDYLSSNVKNFDDIYDKAIPFSVNCIKSAIENAVEVSKNLGIFDMSYEWLSTLMEGYMDCDALFSHYTQVANALENTAKQLASYRGLQRANVPQWYGGGFGIIGAIKGQMQATALNIGTNVIREIGNAVTDSRDKEKFKRVKEWLYKDAGLIDGLIMITYNCSFMPYYALLPIFEEANMVSADAERDEEAVEKAENTFAQYCEEKISKEDSADIMIKLLQKHPFNPLYYIHIGLIESKSHDEIERINRKLGMIFLYKYERKAYEMKSLEMLRTSGKMSIQAKVRFLSLLEVWGIDNKEALQNIKDTLREAWSKEIMLMPEFEPNEMQLKIEAYDRLQEEYGAEWENQKNCVKDYERINTKYEDRVYLTCLQKSDSEIKVPIGKIKECVIVKNAAELWKHAQMQNGYAQALLFQFYNKKCESHMQNLKDTEEVESVFPYLSKEISANNTFAIFIKDSLLYQIRCYNASKDDSEKRHSLYRNANRIYTTILVNKAKNEEMAYAMYLLAHDIFANKSWYDYKAYCRRNTEMPLFSNSEIRTFMKRAADALVPEAVNELASLYLSTDGLNVGRVSEDKEKGFKLLEIRDELRKQFPLSDLIMWYELNVNLPVDSVMIETFKCKICGSAIKVGKKFCSQCGTKVGDE